MIEVVLLSLLAAGGDVQPAVEVYCEKPGYCTAYLQEGDEAPFNGTLAMPAVGISLLEQIRTATTSSALQIERLVALHKIALGAEMQKRRIDNDANAKAQRRLEKVIGDLNSWTRSPALWATVGAVVSAGLVWLASLVLRNVRIP